MIQISLSQLADLRAWFTPERAGFNLVGPHVLHTGCGRAWVDQFPAPRALMVETPQNYILSGSPGAIQPVDLQPLIQGFVKAEDEFEPLLRSAFPDLRVWQRVVFELDQDQPVSPATGALTRRLKAGDEAQLSTCSDETDWISKTWGGPERLASSGYAWGAFIEGKLASVACTWFLGTQIEDLGVATEPGYRGRGLSTACAGALCRDIFKRGHRASWNTSPDNTASQHVAEKLGFRFSTNDRLYITGIDFQP